MQMQVRASKEPMNKSLCFRGDPRGGGSYFDSHSVQGENGLSVCFPRRNI